MLDRHNILSLPGENSQSAKFAKFTNVDDILLAKEVLKSYIYEAIEVEKAGLKIELKKPADLVLVEELVSKLESNPALASAFEALTPGRQRAYNLHFAAAKQSKTRISRIDNSIDRILSGKGINDCTCGLSKRMPNCDGSHKLLHK